MRRSAIILLAVFALNAGSPTRAFTQLLSERFFIEARIRTALYSGERGLQNSTGLEWLVESMRPGTELSLGYRWSESFDVVGQYSRGVYPGINSNGRNLTHLDPRLSGDSRTSFVMEVRYRLLPFGRYEPSLSAGIGVTSGSLNGERRTGLGPVLGVGLARPLGPIVLFSQIQQHLVYPNTALDDEGSHGLPDALTSFSTGIRYHFRKKAVRLGKIKMSAPGSLNTGEEGVFTLTTNLDPVDYSVRWDFGDGSTASGCDTSHIYEKAGSYRASLTASNAKYSDTSARSIVIKENACDEIPHSSWSSSQHIRPT